MARQRMTAILVVAFAAGLGTALLWSNTMAAQQQVPDLEWSFQNGDFSVSNIGDRSYLIVGYSDGEVPTLPFITANGEMVLPSRRVSQLTVYPIAVGAAVQAVDVEASRETEEIVFGPCIPPMGEWCPPGPDCPGCPPRFPQRFAALLSPRGPSQ